ncbi:MAG: hypothetical protein FWD17_04700 [Polyangiaceae bacterium]|nr:hypothetical protein [Polyangiaceae bacterium]
MTHRNTSSCTFGACSVGILVAALGLPACGAGWGTADYYDPASPPLGVMSYPRYVYRGMPVYDVDGRFFAQRRGRWVTFRRTPPEVARWHGARGRAEWQRR